MSSQCMFDQALQNERDLGINFWEAECPKVDSISFTVPSPEGNGAKAIDWNGKLDKVAQSVDQRVKIPHWMKEFTRQGGEMVIHDAGIEDLETYAKQSDLVIVAAGMGDIAKMFERDASARLRQAAACAGADICQGHGKAPRPFGRELQPDPDGRRIFHLPGADDHRPLRHRLFEGIRAGRWTAGRDVSRRKSIWRSPSGCLRPSRPGKPSAARISNSPTTTAFLPARFRPRCASPSAACPPARSFSAWRRRLPQRPDHRSGLQQCIQVRQGLHGCDPRPWRPRL